MSYDLLFQKAIELQQNGALSEAEKLYRQILETAPDNANVLNMLGLIAQEKGLHTEAIVFFYQAIKTAPQHFPIYFNLGISLTALHKFLEAEEAYKKAVSLNPQVKEIYFELGNLYWQQNKIEEAVDSYKKAIAIDEQYADAIINLAELEHNVQILSKYANNNARAAYYLGRWAFDEKKYIKAENYLKVADEILDSAEIKSLLGNVLLILNKKQEALTKFYQARELDNFDASILTHIADIEMDNGNFAEAERLYKEAIAANDNFLQAHANYANFLQNRKRTLEALEEYRKAVLIAPETPELSYNLALILKEIKEYEQALDLMFHAFYSAQYREDWSLNIVETLIDYYKYEPEKVRKIVQNWYEKMPDNISAKHIYEVINETDTEQNKEYNRLLFDYFAETYEQTLQNINYNVVKEICKSCSSFKGVIWDLGCGTGLLGESIKNAENQIIGIDISSKMLKIAEYKNIYDRLVEEDIITFLKRETQKPDVIVAADVFCYFGSLGELLENSYPAKIIFSIEITEEEKAYYIQPNGRYKHKKEYVENVLHRVGYNKISNKGVILRREGASDVEGSIFIAEI